MNIAESEALHASLHQRQMAEHAIRLRRNKALATVDRLLDTTNAADRLRLQRIRTLLNTNSDAYWLDNPSFEGHRHLLPEEI